MDLPMWGTPVIEDGGNTLKILDRRGKSIYIYSNPIVVEKGDWAFMVVDKNGNVVKHSYDSKEDLGIGQKLEIMPNADRATFEVVGNKMYFTLPEDLKNAYPLQAYDAVDTASTNNADNSLEKGTPDGEYGASVFIYVQRSTAETSVDRIVMDWTLSASGGCWNITAIDLYLYLYLQSAGGGTSVEVHELTQTFVELQSSWNHYNDPAHWASAGGDYSATVVDSSNTPLVNNWQSWTLLGAGATNPITGLTWGTNFDILLKYTTENAGGAFQYDVYRSRQAVLLPPNKPYIEITYDVVVAPTVATLEETDVSYITATLNGNITATGGVNSTIRGFQYGLVSGALDKDTHTHGDYGTGTYGIGITGLDADTLYYDRAYATNMCGTSYGAEGNFTTLAYVPPTVGSQSSTVNSGCSVTFWGNVTAIGGVTIDERGFEWGLASGVYTTEWHEHGSWGIGNFTYTWTSADDDTTYFWRARAVNNGLEEGNGAEGNFTTNAVPAPTVLTVDPVTDITAATALGHGNVTDYGDPCEHIDIRGFEWGLVSGVYTGNDTEVGWFTTEEYDLTITGLPFNTLIYYRAMAFNAHLWGYGAEGNFTTLLPIPCAPTDLIVTQTGIGNITITWTNGCYVTNTIVRIQEGSCPATYTDGYEVYNGNGTSATYSGLELSQTEYCIRAWSWNLSGYSVDYAEAKIGGGNMIWIGFIALCGIMSFAALRGRFFGLNLMAGMLWIAMLLYTKGNPPTGITEGDSTHTALLVIFFGIAMMVVLVGIRRGISTTSSNASGFSVNEEMGKWRLPGWTKSETTKRNERRQQRQDDLQAYKDRFHSALNPDEGNPRRRK